MTSTLRHPVTVALLLTTSAVGAASLDAAALPGRLTAVGPQDSRRVVASWYDQLTDAASRAVGQRATAGVTAALVSPVHTSLPPISSASVPPMQSRRMAVADLPPGLLDLPPPA